MHARSIQNRSLTLSATSRDRMGAVPVLRATALAAALALFASVGLAQDGQPAGGTEQTRPAGARGATGAAEADLPVRAVTLYSSGVGYFEHAGSVDGEASAVLRFKTVQINDLLKSLVIQDLDGGMIQAVTYPSNDPVERQLGSFQIDLSGEPTLAAILSQLRGAKITLDNNVSGTVLGVETRSIGEDQVKVEKQYLNVFTGSGLKSVPVDSIATFTLDDQRLQQELARALDALASARDKDKKSVGFNFSGQGQRRIRLGYVVQTPIWKTSYRLLLTEDGEESKANLQGWAIVENQTDNDWTDVRLSLVSGRPMSFVMDLYQPLYVQRPLVVPDLFRSLVPQAYGEGMEALKDEAMAERGRALESMRRAGVATDNRATGGGGGGLGGGGQAPAASAAEGADARYGYAGVMDAGASVQSVAAAANLGELFEYVVGEVDIARQSSAMIPIVTDPVDAEKVSIYDPTVLAKHPLNGVLMKNTSGKHLLQGPMTVLEGGGYAGDAQIGDVPPGETRLLSYGIDLKLNARHEQRPGRTVLLGGKIVDGMMILNRRFRTVHAYGFDNDTDKQRKVVLVHPFDRQYTLVETPDPFEGTETARRFRVEAKPGRTDFIITAEQVIEEQVRLIDNVSIEQFLAYASWGELPQKVRDALTQAAELQRSVQDGQRQLQQVQAEIAAISTEQTRLRENMKTVDNASDYYKRLLKKLDEQETQIETLQKRQAELTVELEKRRAALRDYLVKLNVA